MSQRNGQAGVTLVEVLVAVAVVVPVVLASTLGLFTAIELGRTTQSRQELESVMSSVVDGLRSMEPYVPCGAPEAYTKLAAEDPLLRPLLDAAEPSVRIVRVEYWDQRTAAFVPSCGADRGAQRLVVEVVDVHGSLTGEVVKRDPSARPEGDR